MLSKRIQTIEPSGIRKVFEMATRIDPASMVNLSIGQPDFPTPKPLKQAAKRAIDHNANSYVSTQGLGALREKIAAKLRQQNNIAAQPDDIIVTAGVSGAIVLLLGSIIDPGDEVILPDPYFVLYQEVLAFLGAKIVYLDTYPDFHLQPEKLKALITPKTKALILNSPNNPTGAVLSQTACQEIASVCALHNILVISDEIYEAFDYSGQFFSIGSIHPNTVTLNGFSKSHAIPGWRVGYAHGPHEIIEAMNTLQMYTFVCAPSFAQQALAETWDQIDITTDIQRYRRNSERIYDALKDYYTLEKPEGAFYAYLKQPEVRDFVERCLQEHLLIVPGDAFSQKSGYFRISFAASEETIEKGIAILKKITNE